VTDAIRSMRLLDNEPQTAAWHVACTGALLEARAGGLSPDTIRFLSFSHPALLLGAHQLASEFKGELQRRITGGPAVPVGPDVLGWEILISRKSPPETADVLLAALKILGYPAQPQPGGAALGGKAVARTVQTSEKGALLVQGFLFVRRPADADVASLLDSGAGASPPPAEIRRAFVEAYSDRLGVHIEPGDLTNEERALLATRVPEVRSDAWIRPAPAGQVFEASARGKGGSVRASVVHGEERNRIRQVVFSGDFCAHPRTAVRDLEKELEGSLIDEAPARIETYFTRTGAELTGLVPGDLFMALSLAFMKRRLTLSSAPDPSAWKKEAGL
jgi:lipoate-protein ligase A